MSRSQEVPLIPAEPRDGRTSESDPPQPLDNERVRFRIFLPLIAAGVLLLAAFVIGVYWKTTHEIAHGIDHDITKLNETFAMVLQSEAEHLEALLETLTFAPAMADFFEARKREALQHWVQQRYDNLRSAHDITHLYFLDADRRCFLRVHQPERHGDVINRKTLLEAQRTGRPASGLELGPLGTLTLRAVIPWRVDGRLVGYLEMGKEIGPIAERISAMLKIDIALLIHKRFLVQADWEKGLQMLDHRGAWSDYPDWVLVYPTAKKLPAVLTEFLAAKKDLTARRFSIARDRRHFRVAIAPFADVDQREIGGRLLVYDVTNAVAEARALVAFAGGIVFVIGSLLFVVLYIYLGRVESRLIAARRKSLEESRERERIQRLHLEERRKAQEELESKVQERTVALMNTNELLRKEIAERLQAEKLIRESEEKYRTLFEEFRDAIVISTPEGQLVDANPAGVALFGYASKEEFLQTAIQDFYVDPADRRTFQTLMAEQGFVQNRGLLLKCKSGAQIQVDESASAVRDEQGEITSYRRIMRDITELKRFEKQFIQAQKMQSIGTLASGLAHDFNNILGSILCYASLMKFKIAKDHPFYNYIETIEKGTKRAAELTAQLLAFGRGGKFEITPLDINQIIAETRELIERTFDKAIQIKVNLQERLPTVEGDAGQIQQLLMNLCVNARDAMPAGGVLSIATNVERIGDDYLRQYSYARPGDFVVIAASDTGSGMDKATQERIFEPFFTTKEQGKGTGLGLAMVYGVVKNHGGWVNVYSEPGFGSIFKVYLPASTKASLTFPAEDTVVCLGNEVVLVVDDEDMIREMLKETLESFNYRVLLAHNGIQALKLYTEYKGEIDLVLLDMIMPLMGGAETFAQLKQIDPDVRVILTTGYSQNGKAQTIIDGGVRGFMQKPYNVDMLLRTIRTALEDRKPA